MNKPIRCTTHFHACDCREYEFEKVKRHLEIQTKRVENLRKSNEFYADPESWIKRTGEAWNKSSPREKHDGETIRHYKHPYKDWIGTVVVGGKLARECQAKDQELQKRLGDM